MPEKDKRKQSVETELPRSDRPDSVMPPDWASSMMMYGDVSRMLFRMHRNVAAHIDAQKRLVERMQSVFAHEQSMVMELAKLVDESMSLAARQSNEQKAPLGKESLERIFNHASNAMQETGRMMTDIQLEALDLLRHYIDDAGKAGDAAPASQPNEGKTKK
jgi:hypothetical protein